MTRPEDALTDLRRTLDEIHEFLIGHGMARAWARISILSAMAAVDDEPPEDVLHDIWREHVHTMGQRDGFGEVYVADDAGAVDREASRQLSELQDQLARIIKDWGPPERDA